MAGLCQLGVALGSGALGRGRVGLILIRHFAAAAQAAARIVCDAQRRSVDERSFPTGQNVFQFTSDDHEHLLRRVLGVRG